MRETLLILAFLFIVLPVQAQSNTGSSKEKTVPLTQEDDSLSRKDIEKKYKGMTRNLKSNARRKLSFVTTSVYKSFKLGGRNSDYYVMARNEIKKKFGLATADQFQMLIFYTLVGTLKKVEKDIDYMTNQQHDSSTMFDNLIAKEFQLYLAVIKVLKDVQKTKDKIAKSII